MALTNSSGLYSPDVWAAAAKADIEKKLVWAGVSIVKDDLEGVPGEAVQMPKFNALSDLEELTEGEAMIPERLTQSKTSAKIKSFGKAVEISDFAQLVGTGNAQDEALSQFGTLTAQKIDAELMAAALAVVTGGIENVADGSTADSKPLVHNAGTGVTFSYDALVDATALAGESFTPSEWVALVNTADRARAMKDDVFIKAAQGNGENGAVNKGVIGDLAGVEVQVSDRIPNGVTVLVKKNSVALYWKRRPLVETDRDILSSTTVFATTVHFATARIADKGIIRINWNTAAV
jgi:N4-gp56 family major capsid protein